MAQQVSDKQQFRNNLHGWTHVMVLDHESKPKTQGVEPGGVVWLTELEQQLTANMHQKPQDNPFVAREHVHFDEKTLEESRRFTAPTLELVDGGVFTGRPTGAAQGSYARGEVTGTAV